MLHKNLLFRVENSKMGKKIILSLSIPQNYFLEKEIFPTRFSIEKVPEKL